MYLAAIMHFGHPKAMKANDAAQVSAINIDMFQEAKLNITASDVNLIE